MKDNFYYKWLYSVQLEKLFDIVLLVDGCTFRKALILFKSFEIIFLVSGYTVGIQLEKL